MTKRVLLIAYYFPPRQGVASLRLRGLAKYLPEFGWEPVILTAALPGESDDLFRVIQTPYPGDIFALLKKRLLLQPKSGFQEQIGIPLAVRGSKHSISGWLIRFAKGFIAYPDEQKYWLPFGIETGHKLLQKEKFDVMISSSGPVTSHLIAKELKKRTGIPWIADFRDLWTQNHYYPYSGLRRQFERRLELKTLVEADMLVTVSAPLAKELGSLHHRKPVFVVTNGFDPDEIKSAPLSKKFTITYTGQIYKGKQNPELLLVILHELIIDGVIEPTDVEVRFLGPPQYWLDQKIRKYHLEQVVKQQGIVPREVALTKQRESQILLLLNWDDPRERGVYTGKVFEYLAAQRPILAIGGPDGVVSELFEVTEAGTHVKNVAALREVLHNWYKEYHATGQVPYYGKEKQIARYSHREMAKKFAEVLASVNN